MTNHHADKLDRVARYSRSLRQLFQVLLGATVVALIVGTLLIAMGMEPYDTSVSVGGAIYAGERIPGVVRAMAVAGFMLSTGILVKVLFHLVKLFGLYANGKIFSPANVHQIRQIGIAVLLVPALWVLGSISTLLVPDEGLAKGIESHAPFTELVVGIIVIVVSWVMDVGRELREEQDLVV